MRNFLTILLFGLSATIVPASGADNSIGTWKLNVQKSQTSDVQLPLKSLTTTRQQTVGGVIVTTTGERADGTRVHVKYVEHYDGKMSDFMGSGAPYDMISIAQVDANTFTDEQKKTGGEYHTTGRTGISRDGKTMTVTRSGTSTDGTAFTATYVYEER